MSFEAFVQAFVACYFIFVALLYTARLSGLRARRGFVHAPVGRAISANGAHQILFRVFRTAILVLMVGRVFSEGIDATLLPIGGLEAPPLQAAGLVLLSLALVVVDYARAHLADEWRSGIAARPGEILVESGPYAVSRNPIFAGVLAGQVGLFLAAPSVFTLICLAVGWVVILRQVKVEERCLAGRFGERWTAYAARVPRWSNVGRLAWGGLATR